MRILITGAAGFIGSHLCDRLLSDGHSVIGVDNFLTGRRRNLEHLAAHPRFQLVEHDVIEPMSVVGEIDAVLNFACPASPPKYLAFPIETLRVCSEGTRNLLELARSKDAVFLQASTSEVYGDPEVHPQPESYVGHVNPVGPRSVYDEGKRYAEALVTAHGSRGTRVRIARIFNTYGPRMDPQDGRVVTNFLRQAMRGEPLTIFGDGSQTRSFQFVDDLVDGLMRLLGSDHPGPVNLGNPEEYTMHELVALIREELGIDAPIVFEPLPADDPRQRRPSIDLAERLLGWTPRVSVREGLRRTAAYFRAHEQDALR